MTNRDTDVYKALMNIYTKENASLIIQVKEGQIDVSAFKKDVLDFIDSYYKSECDHPEEIASTIIDSLFGYSVITELIKDKSITDIKILDWNRIIVKSKGKNTISDVKFESLDAYNRFIESVITRNEINASTKNAYARFVDDDSFEDYILRFTLLTPFLTTNEGYVLIIRKTLKQCYLLDELVEQEMMEDDVKECLKDRMKKGSLLICGANSSGKTTLLNALKEEIPHDESVCVIQQADELSTHKEGGHPNMIFMHSIEGDDESGVSYTLKDLSILGLTMDIQWFIIGEIKGAEASYLLNSSYTGHNCAGTIHSGSSTTALDKLVDYALYDSSYTKNEFMSMLTSFKTVVFMKNYQVNEISEIIGIEDGEILYRPIYRSGR